jgi:hypothetical protein
MVTAQQARVIEQVRGLTKRQVAIVERTARRLTEEQVAELAATAKPGTRHRVSRRLYLHTDRKGAQNWSFRYQIDGRPHEFYLGRYHARSYPTAIRMVARLRTLLNPVALFRRETREHTIDDVLRPTRRLYYEQRVP